MATDDETAAAEAEARSAHTTGHTSARSQRIEVITRGERRRRWSIELRAVIVTLAAFTFVVIVETLSARGFFGSRLEIEPQAFEER